MVSSPSQLNEIGDDLLQAHVTNVLQSLGDSTMPSMPSTAPFVTADVLLRLHNIIAEVRCQGNDCAGWTKQAALARVVGAFTGVKVNRADAEHIGNAQDYFLKNYVKHLTKARKAEARARSRAEKAGREPPASCGDRVSELKLQVYKCKFGGVPRSVVFCKDDVQGRHDSSKHPPQSVPWRTIRHADEVNLELQQHIIQLKEHVGASDRQTRLNFLRYEQTNVDAAASIAACAKADARAARQRAHAACAELEEVKTAVESADMQAKRWKQKVKESEQKHARSEREMQTAENMVLCLQGKLVRALSEAEGESRKRKQCEEATGKQISLVRSDLEAMKGEVQMCKTQLMEAEKQCRIKETEVIVLEGKLVRVFTDVHHEQSKRQRLADREVAQLRCHLQEARDEVEACKQHVRVAERACATKKGEVYRLEGKLGRALMALAQAKENAGAAKSKAMVLNAKLIEQEQTAQAEKEHLRGLKNKMAREKRDAQRLASTAGKLEAELSTTRHRLRQLRKEVNVTRVELCMEALESGGESLSEGDGEDEEYLDGAQAASTMMQMKMSTRMPASSTSALDQNSSLAMPTWRAVRGKGAGRGAPKLEWGTRLVIYMLLSLLVPPASIGMVIVAIVMRTAPWLRPTAPTAETVKRCRFELRFFEEALAARRVASAYRIRGIGFDETTKLGNNALTSNLTIEPTAGAPLEDVILRAAYCPTGCTSEQIVSSIEKRCVERLRGRLWQWKSQFERMFPEQTWSGPDVSQCSLHRLGGGGAIMSDTCNTARLAKTLLQKLVAKQVEEQIGEEAWGQLSEAERNAAIRVHKCDCSQHIRNIFLAEMSRAQAEHVQKELQPELDTFAAWERMNTNFAQLLRAAFKEFHHSCRYYKGQGRPFSVWLKETHPTGFCIHLERADGGRQDLDYDAALPLYIDRPFFVEFLHDRVFEPKHRNILEDFLYVTFRSTQYIAMIRANALVDILISRPLRWLSGKSSELLNWSPFSMGEAFDAVEQFLVRAQHDGRLFLDPNQDIFKSIADRQPAFARWRTHTFDEETRLAPDGRTKHLLYQRARQELMKPSDPTNAAAEAKTIEYLQVQSAAALRKLHDPKLALRDKLTSVDGENCIGNAVMAHDDTVGCHSTNDVLAESVFGTFDMVLRRFQGVSMEAASGVAQAVRSKMLSLGDHVARRKVGTKPVQGSYVGYVHSLPERELEALVECARLTVKECRDTDKADHSALDEYHKHRRKTNEHDELDALFTRYALALSFFERWQKRGVERASEITAALKAFGDREQAKLDWLREQIEMRVIGLSWNDVKTPWSSSADEAIGTVAQLTEHLKEEILVREVAQRKAGELPSKEGTPEESCPAPLLQRKTFKTLGTPTVQADRLCQAVKAEPSSEEKLEAAKQRRTELEERGELDWVSDRQPYATGQGPVPDENLIGKKLEVRWRYYNKDTGEPIYIWCEGNVVQVADGEKDKQTARCRKLLPAGALRIQWPADAEFDEDESFVWTILKPCAFNKDIHLGWRFAASELKRMQENTSQRARRK